MKYFKYLSYIVRHKWFVLVECWKLGLYWRGLVHDLSKLLPSEFFPYVNFFYGTKDSSITSKRDSTGYYKPTDTGDKSFDRAWLLHQKRNDHHWQWWILPCGEGETKVFKMSYEAVIEMVCDWRGAGRAQGKPDILKWYDCHKKKMLLHPETRELVEKLIGYSP